VHFRVIQRILGLLVMLFSVSMLPPVFISAWYHDGSAAGFVLAFVVTLLTGFLLWVPARNDTRELRSRDGFLVVAAFWTVLSSFGAAPLVFVDVPDLTITQAVFEAVSGLTTTGATALTGLDLLPRSVLYYRAQLNWLGGMGIVVLAVAVLPMLGVGGFQLYRAETPGAIKDTKLTPRITQTAKALWYLYLGLTAACTVSYWLAGMPPFDALCHAFATLGTGGFSTHDASIAYYHNPTLNLVVTGFMFLGGVNFSLHFLVWRSKRISQYLRDAEFRSYLSILAVLIAFCMGYLLISGVYTDPQQAAADAAFTVVSVMTTSGFRATDFSVWPGALPLVMIFIMFIGGCAGSAAGGMKVIRWQLLYRQGIREVVRLVHPSAEIPIKFGTATIPQRVVEGVWGFFAMYVVFFAAMLLVLMASGLDQVTAFAAIATCINNVGPGLGKVAHDFSSFGVLDQWVCILAMLLGRLEIFTLFVLISPAFWRR
jgi:trk system potassium uptake protein TrkH